MHGKIFQLLLFVCFLPYLCLAQIIHGEVYDKESLEPVGDVKIFNIHTSLDVSTNATGTFVIAAAGGQLLEFKKQGYRLVRVRIPMGYMPSYFKIAIEKGMTQLKELKTENRYNYKADSLRFYELYKHELDFPQMSAMDIIAHPFSAMSSKSREIWRFQEEYDINEKEKYIDRTFNEALVTKFTGLTGDSLHYYMRRYRPTYDQLRSMGDYTYFSFIKQSVQTYRHPQTPRGAQ